MTKKNPESQLETVQSTLPTVVTNDKVQIVSRDDVKIGTIVVLCVMPSGMVRPCSISPFKGWVFGEMGQALWKHPQPSLSDSLVFTVTT